MTTRAEVCGRGDVGARDGGGRVDDDRAREGVGPDEHLHPRADAVNVGVEVGVVRPRPVLRLGAHVVVGAERRDHGASAVVVDLEVAGDFVEAVLVEHVVDDVVPVEEIRDRRGAIGRGRSRRVVEGEVELERRPAVGVAVHVGDVVGVDVGVGVDVVAARARELGAGGAVRVVPAEGRGERVRGVRDERAPAVGRTLEGEGEDVVGRAVVDGRQRGRSEGPRGGRGRDGSRGGGHRREAPVALHVRGEVRAPVVAIHEVVAGEHVAGLGVEPQVPVVLAAEFADLDAPRQTHVAVVHGLVDELGGDRVGGDAARAEGHPVLRAALRLDRPERLREGQPEVLRGGFDGLRRRQRGAAALGATETADEAAVEVDELAVARHVGRRVGADDLDAADLLPEINVRDAVVPARVLIRHPQLGEVGLLKPEAVAVLLQEADGDVEGLALVGGGQRASAPGGFDRHRLGLVAERLRLLRLLGLVGLRRGGGGTRGERSRGEEQGED